MKPTIWTEPALRELMKTFSCPSDFKRKYSGAYKASLKFKLASQIWPMDQRQRHPEYTEESLVEISKAFKKRSQMQLQKAAAYNAAKRMGIIDKLFPIQLNRKYLKEQLYQEALKYSSRSLFEKGSPKQYQVAQKRRIIDEICPPKMQGTSLAELEILEFLKTLSPDFKTKRFGNDYELDCYSETLKMGIEYNGFYWHSEEKVGKKYHLLKTKYFETLNVRVIHIFQHEWRDRKEQVKVYLQSACGKNSIRIGARKCEFKEIDQHSARELLKNSHIQGAPSNIKKALGCFYKDLLIGVCTFGSHHRQSGHDYMVLNRLAFLPGHTVSGALNKFCKLAFESYGPLQSWADLSKSQARGYLAAGWTIDEVLKPDYFYATSQGKVISKQNRRKSAVNTPKDMTESQHAKKDGLMRIWDCGKVRLLFNPS